MRTFRSLAFLAFLGLLLAPMLSMAGAMSLAWTAPPAPTASSGCTYSKIQVDYGPGKSGAYIGSVQTVAATDTSITISGLDEGKTYYFAAKTLGSCAGVAKTSAYSNEVSGEVPIGSPGALKLSLAPVTATFAPTPIGTVATRTWSLNNRGTDPLALSVPAFDHPAFRSSSGAKTIAPGAQARYTISFAPTDPGYQEGRLILRTATAEMSYPVTGFALSP
jgi:hypothetical protein